ncbi:MAG: hypothetical protein EXR77_10460 [Myxococcales bacterium]|nr:hypothetical protein [Myxococcales bacterium]
MHSKRLRLLNPLGLLVLALAACGTKQPSAIPPQAAAGIANPAGALLAVPAAGELTVTFAMPRGDVEAPAMGAVAFNQPMVAVSAVDEPVAATQIHVSPPVGLSARWMGTTTLGFWPTAPLKGSTRYSVQLDAFTALSGKTSAPHSWSFRTAPAKVVRSWPAAGSSEVQARTDIFLEFDQEVDPEALAKLVHVEAGKLAVPAVRLRALTQADYAQLQEQTTDQPRTRRGVPVPRPAVSVSAEQLRHFVAIIPQTPLPAAALIALIVAPGSYSLEGPEPTRAAFRSNFSTLGPLRVVSAGCDGQSCDPDLWAPLHVALNNHLPQDPAPWQQAAAGSKPSGLTQYFRLTPAVPGLQVRCWSLNCSLAARDLRPVSDTTVPRLLWKPQTEYTLEVLAGLPDIHGQTLKTAYKTTFRMGQRKPVLSVLVDGSVLERKEGPHLLAVALRNAPQVKAQALVVGRDDLARVLQHLNPVAPPAGAQPAASPVQPLAFPIQLPFKGTQLADTDERGVLDIDAAIGGRGRAGVTLVQVTGPTGADGPLQQEHLLRITDLHILAKAAHGTAVFWVTRFSTGKPAAAVQLRVVRRDGSEVWKGATNAHGLATGPANLVPARDPDSDSGDDDDDSGAASAATDYLVVASLEDDWTFLELDDSDNFESWRYRDGGSANRGVLFSDKTLYKRGETVNFKGIVRTIGAAAIGVTGVGEAVTIELRDPQQRSLAKVQTTLSENGTFDGQMPLPVVGAYGTHTLKATLTGHSLEANLEVRTYRTPKFRMQVRSAGPHHLKGDPIVVDVVAGYYSGGPLGNAPISLAISGHVQEFSPPNWAEFTFGGGWRFNDSGIANSFSYQAQGTLDAAGKIALTVPTSQSTATGSLPLNVEATAQDPNAQPVSQSVQTWLHPAAVHAGVRLLKGMVAVGSPLELQMVAPDALGTLVAGAKLKATVVRRQHLQVREIGIGGVLEWRTETKDSPIGGCDHSAGVQAITCAVVLTEPGLHIVTVHATDSQGRRSQTTTSAVAYGKGDANWDQTEDRSALLVPDQPSYKVGQTAKVVVKNKLNNATALVTEERDGVLRTRLVRLEGEAPVLEVPIERRHAPNFYLGVAVFSGRIARAEVGREDTGSPVLQIAYAAIQVDTGDRSLQVQLQPNKLKFRPQEQVQVQVQVADAAGKPTAGEVTLWAVDEGVMALSGQKRPEVLDILYADVGLGVHNLAMIHDLIKGRVGEDKGQDGGGGATMRGDFRDVPVWLPKLQVGADGKALATFVVPDNLTSFRLMAVAIAGADRAGGSDATITVDKPLMLLATYPAQVHVGDEFEVALTLRNRSGADATGSASLAVAATGSQANSLEVASNGGQASLLGESVQAWQLGKDASRELAFRLRATKAGAIAVQVRAQMGSEKDGLQQVIHIVDPMPTESVATWGTSLTSVQEAVQKSAVARSGVGGVEIKASTTALVALQGSLQWLMRYPYGCSEQLASQLQAFLWTERMAEHYAVLPEQRKLGLLRAQQAIDRLMANRSSSAAALTLWPNESQGHVLATAWGLRLLHQAKQAGLRVDETLLKDAPAWLRQQLSAATEPAGAQTAQAESHAGVEPQFHYEAPQANAVLDDTTAAQVVATLAALGQPAAGDVDALFGRRQQMPVDAQLFVAEAAALVGGDGLLKAKTIIDELTRSAHLDAASAHMVTVDSADMAWMTPVRSNALLLTVMLQATPDHPLLPRLARWLLEQRKDDRWGTTQDNAWALRGLGAWMQSQDGPAADQQIAVLVGGRQLGAGKIAAKSLQSLSFSLDQEQLPAGQVPVVLQTSGGGALHYSVRYTYSLQVDAEYAKNAGFFVQRLAFDAQGNKGPLRLVRGDHVAVAVVVVNDRARRDVAIVDQLPAGLEPLDDALRTTSLAALDSMSKLRQRLLGAELNRIGPDRSGRSQPEQWDGDGYDHRELAGREIRWFVNNLPAGVHVYTYVARAAVRGQFVGRGSRAEAMYAPEVFGTSGPNRLTVE